MNDAAPALLSLRAIGKSFGGVQALRDVSLDIRAGEVHCLAGENGSGKSTIVKLIAGVHQPTSGRIQIGGRDLPALSPIEALRLGIQVIYQDLSLFPLLSVAENLALNTLLERGVRVIRPSTIRQIASAALVTLGISMPLDRPVGELPIAQRQLVAIARALLQDAKLVILDEPTTALTDVEVQSLFAVVRSLTARGVAMLFVSHKMREMRHISDRFTVLRNGEVVASGPARDFDDTRIAVAMTGRVPGGDRFHPTVGLPAAPLLRVTNLAGSVLRGVSFELRAGEILGLTGLLGAGQSEVGLALAGLRRSAPAEIAVEGHHGPLRGVADARRAGIAYVPEDRLSEGLFLDQSIERNTNASSLRGLRDRFGLVSRRRSSAQASRLMRELGVKLSSLDAPVRTLSGGNQQRVVLAKWLATRPRLLVLSSPTAGVDIGSKEDIHLMIRRCAEQGMGLILISDDLTELAHNATRVLLFRRGLIGAELAGDDLTEPRLLEELSLSA